MPYPVHADLLSAHPGQAVADAGPQVVGAAAGDRSPLGVAKQLPAGRGVPLLAVLDQAGHQGGGDRCRGPSPFSRSRTRHWSGSRQDQALVRIEVLRADRERPPPRRQAVSVCSRSSSVSSSGSFPVVAAAWLISASRVSGTARRVDGRRRGLATFRAGLSAARDRWLKPGGVMIPRLVMAWAALVHDRHLGEMVEFLRDSPYGLRFDDLIEKTVNEIFYSGTFRHLAARDKRSGAPRLWTTDADLIPLQQARAPHEAETELPIRDHGTANALALWFSAQLAPGISLSVGPGDPPTHWGMTTAPLRSPMDLTPGMAVRARVRPAPARPAGTWTSWAIALPGADWEEHDEQAVWEEIDD